MFRRLMDEHVCDVWVADLAVSQPALDALLDDVELARADSFLRADDRDRFVVGAALIKLAVAHGTDLPAAAIHVDRQCPTCGKSHGQPRVLAFDVHVSVAHSGSLVAIAATRAGPVGIDVERRVAHRTKPVERVVTAAEPVSHPDDLLTYWCRKESAVKATGDGLRVPLHDVVVSSAAEPARLVSYRGRDLTAFMTDLDLGDTYAAALTVLTASRVAVRINPAASLLAPG